MGSWGPGFLGRAVGLDLAGICPDRGGEERSCYSVIVCTVLNNCLHTLEEEQSFYSTTVYTTVTKINR